MSKDLIRDIGDMHAKYGVNAKVREFDKEKLKAFLDFRYKFLKEEMDEIEKAINEGDADGIVDGIIDLMVVSIGTLDAFDVNSYKAWDRVHVANMSKEVGIKASRPNPLGLPDLIKPVGWSAPSHKDNIGLFEKIYK